MVLSLTLPLDEVLDLALASPPVQDLLHLVLLLASCSVVAHSSQNLSLKQISAMIECLTISVTSVADSGSDPFSFDTDPDSAF
jgi:hypothetical protein